jgi:DNA integrity scanning protein DisA with diadenylate cyclase activity
MHGYEQTGSKAAQANICVSTLALALPLISVYVFSLTDSFRGADYIHEVRNVCILTTVGVLKQIINKRIINELIVLFNGSLSS